MILTQGKNAQNAMTIFTNHLRESVMSILPAEFEILFRFLELADEKVQGRQSARPPADIERLVMALLSGQLAEEKRIELKGGAPRPARLACSGSPSR